ncbi:MAG: hypothetical protein OXT65_09155 [Alphaproteobacteria bacterium]|nr:hypothetical protein [Alphaproteobacteria bacterium]
MPQLTLNGRGQSVTALVTYQNEGGDLHLLLIRPDPRYRDRQGECLEGTKLPVGPCQFVGGMVEPVLDDAVLSDIEKKYPGFNKMPSAIDRRVAVSALRELAEEASFPAEKYMSKNATLELMEIVSSDNGLAMNKEQDLHYVHLSLGTLSDADIKRLEKDVAPYDDAIQSILIGVDKLKLDAAGDIQVTPQDGIVKTKDDFNGFPEMPTWRVGFSRLIAQFKKAGQHDKAAKSQARFNVFARIHKELRDLDGVDVSTLNPANTIGMYRPPNGNRRNDSDILQDFLQTRFGLVLGALPGMKNATPKKPPAP